MTPTRDKDASSVTPFSLSRSVNRTLLSKLDGLRADHKEVVGRPFSHFFCPILRSDEPSPLSMGHVINAAFRDSDRHRIVRRTDVDSFFGRNFEADFVLFQDKGAHDPIDTLFERELSRKLRPRISVDGRRVNHYLPTGPVPENYTELVVDRGDGPRTRLALKLERSEMLTALNGQWELVFDKDIRLHALVSLLKAAHLTLFALIGYSYALSLGGWILGWDVLGKFIQANLSNEKPTALANAQGHFTEFSNLVRPLLTSPSGMAGTITDRQLFLCTGTPKAWAMMVLIRTGQHMHAVLVPLLEDDEAAARFVEFLGNPVPRFAVRRTLYHNDRWEVDTRTRMVEWPEGRFA